MIIINNLTKSLGEKDLFRNLSCTLNAGDVLAAIGQNGCGKSTLLRIIAEKEEADEGTVTAFQESIYLAPQHIEAPKGVTIQDYLDPEEYPETWRLLGELDLIDIPFDTKIEALSGGQKTKLLLVKTCAMPATTLLLDEPTNHLDAKTRAWLVQEIQAHRGIIVMVSHDRAFLNACATKVLEIDAVNARTMLVHGNYDVYKKEKEEWMIQQREAFELQQKKKREMLAWLALKRQEASVYPDPAKGRRIRQMERRLDREIFSQEIVRPSKGKYIDRLGIAGDVHEGKLIVRVKHVVKTYEKREVLRDVSFELRGSVHARVLGENGSGKSTLLKIMIGEVPVDGGMVEIGIGVRIGYFSQELEHLEKKHTVFEAFIRGTQGFTEARARAVLGSFLFSGDAIFTRVEQLSYGERMRLQCAILLQGKYELLILDEPTNHLDIPSREAIERALVDYEGALLVVSHDEYFVQQIGIDMNMVMQGGKLTIIKK